jgi:hypothetical protein
MSWSGGNGDRGRDTGNQRVQAASGPTEIAERTGNVKCGRRVVLDLRELAQHLDR